MHRYIHSLVLFILSSYVKLHTYAIETIESSGRAHEEEKVPRCFQHTPFASAQLRKGLRPRLTETKAAANGPCRTAALYEPCAWTVSCRDLEPSVEIADLALGLKRYELDIALCLSLGASRCRIVSAVLHRHQDAQRGG